MKSPVTRELETERDRFIKVATEDNRTETIITITDEVNLDSRSQNDKLQKNESTVSTMSTFKRSSLQGYRKLSKVFKNMKDNSIMKSKPDTMSDYEKILPVANWTFQPQVFILKWLVSISPLYNDNTGDEVVEELFEKTGANTSNIISYLSKEASSVYKSSELSWQYQTECVQSVAETLRHFLDIANEILDTDELASLYRFDSRLREVQVFNEAQNDEILLYKELLRHKATDRFLDNKLRIKNDEGGIFTPGVISSVIAGLLYPVLTILSLLWKDLRYTLFAYPVPYYTMWASYFYVTILLYKHNNYFLETIQHELRGEDF